MAHTQSLKTPAVWFSYPASNQISNNRQLYSKLQLQFATTRITLRVDCDTSTSTEIQHTTTPLLSFFVSLFFGKYQKAEVVLASHMGLICVDDLSHNILSFLRTTGERARTLHARNLWRTNFCTPTTAHFFQ